MRRSLLAVTVMLLAAAPVPAATPSPSPTPQASASAGRLQALWNKTAPMWHRTTPLWSASRERLLSSTRARVQAWRARITGTPPSPTATATPLPKDFETLRQRAQALTDKRQEAEAIPLWQAALALRPNDPRALYGMGICQRETEFAKTGHTDNCLQYLRAAYKVAPNDYAILVDLASAHVSASSRYQNVQEAVDVCNKAMRLFPKKAGPHYILGNLYLGPAYTLEEYDKAIGFYREAIKRVPDWDDPYDKMSWAYVRSGRTKEAAETYRAWLRHNPKNGDAHRMLAGCLYKMGNLDGALAEYRAGSVIDPDFAGGHKRQAEILHLQGRFAAAILAYQKAIDLMRRDPDFATDDTYKQSLLETQKFLAMAQRHERLPRSAIQML